MVSLPAELPRLPGTTLKVTVPLQVAVELFGLLSIRKLMTMAPAAGTETVATWTPVPSQPVQTLAPTNSNATVASVGRGRTANLSRRNRH